MSSLLFCFCRLSASGLDALIRRESHTVDKSRIVSCVLRMAFIMILLRLFCSTLQSALGLATAVVEPLAPPSCLVRLAVRRSRLGFCCSSDGPWARARVHILSVACSVWAVEQARQAASFGSSVLGQADVSSGQVPSTFASLLSLARRGCN